MRQNSTVDKRGDEEDNILRWAFGMRQRQKQTYLCNVINYSSANGFKSERGVKNETLMCIRNACQIQDIRRHSANVRGWVSD